MANSGNNGPQELFDISDDDPLNETLTNVREQIERSHYYPSHPRYTISGMYREHPNGNGTTANGMARNVAGTNADTTGVDPAVSSADVDISSAGTDVADMPMNANIACIIAEAAGIDLDAEYAYLAADRNSSTVSTNAVLNADATLSDAAMNDLNANMISVGVNGTQESGYVSNFEDQEMKNRSIPDCAVPFLENIEHVVNESYLENGETTVNGYNENAKRSMHISAVGYTLHLYNLM